MGEDMNLSPKENSEIKTISDKIIALAQNHFGRSSLSLEETDMVRRALGLTLCGIHTTIMATAKTDEAKSFSVNIWIDSIERLGSTLHRASQDYGIEGVVVASSEIEDANETSEDLQ
jgi:hypothetical protein